MASGHWAGMGLTGRGKLLSHKLSLRWFSLQKFTLPPKLNFFCNIQYLYLKKKKRHEVVALCPELFITCLMVWTNMILLLCVVNRSSTYGSGWQNYDKIHCILKNDWKVCRWFLGVQGGGRIEFQQKTCQVFFSSYCSPCFHIPAFLLLDTRVKQVSSPQVICFSLALGIPSHFVMFTLW